MKNALFHWLTQQQTHSNKCFFLSKNSSIQLLNAYSIGLCGNINGFYAIIPIGLFCVAGIRTIHFRLKLIDQILLYPNGSIFVVKLALKIEIETSKNTLQHIVS